MAKTRGNGLLMAWTDVDPAIEAAFNAWYDSEHIPRLLEIPGLDRIVLDEINFRRNNLTEFQQGQSVLFGVVDTFPHHILIGHLALCFLIPILQSIPELR